MKTNYSVTFLLALVLILIVYVLAPFKTMGETPALAQLAGVVESPTQALNAPSMDITPTMSYQGRLVENGSPVSGSRSMTFRLYDAITGGILYWTEGPKSVPVSNGLFTVTLGDTTALHVNYFGRQLYLEIEVAGTVLPRQELRGTPYAFSLAPGAEVNGDTTDSIVYAGNAGGGDGLEGVSHTGNGMEGSSEFGHGVVAESTGNGVDGSALHAKNNSSNGVALVAQNDNAGSTGATLILSNEGTGDLLEGFGGDGGNEEIKIKNDGTFQDKAPSYVFVPGATAAIKLETTGAYLSFSGSAVYVSASTAGEKKVCLAATLPSVLYGQPVKVEQLTIYYYTQSSLNSIDYTALSYMVTAPGYMRNIVLNEDVHNSTTYTSYSYETDSGWNTLSANDGFLSVCLGFNFMDTNYQVYLDGARLKLRHHPLY